MAEAEYTFEVQPIDERGWALFLYKDGNVVGGGEFGVMDVGDELASEYAHDGAVDMGNNWLDFWEDFDEAISKDDGLQKLDSDEIAGGNTLVLYRVANVNYEQYFWRIYRGETVLFDSALAGIFYGSLCRMAEAYIAFLASSFYEALVNDGVVRITTDDIEQLVDNFKLAYGNTSPFFVPPPTLTGGE